MSPTRLPCHLLQHYVHSTLLVRIDLIRQLHGRSRRRPHRVTLNSGRSDAGLKCNSQVGVVCYLCRGAACVYNAIHHVLVPSLKEGFAHVPHQGQQNWHHSTSQSIVVYNDSTDRMQQAGLLIPKVHFICHAAKCLGRGDAHFRGSVDVVLHHINRPLQCCGQPLSKKWSEAAQCFEHLPRWPTIRILIFSQDDHAETQDFWNVWRHLHAQSGDHGAQQTQSLGMHTRRCLLVLAVGHRKPELYDHLNDASDRLSQMHPEIFNNLGQLVEHHVPCRAIATPQNVQQGRNHLSKIRYKLDPGLHN
mmetsp:Transcript_24663/g.73990  ORF Transcript_24663/g.73990 Transcript_24663/m.73990 type:complete len:304 (+) Transcript_24663:5522-6433(+)